MAADFGRPEAGAQLQLVCKVEAVGALESLLLSFLSQYQIVDVSGSAARFHGTQRVILVCNGGRTLDAW